MWRLFIGGAPPQVRPIDLLLVTLGLIKVDFKEDFLDCRGAFEDGALGTDMAWPGLAWPGLGLQQVLLPSFFFKLNEIYAGTRLRLSG